MKRKAKTFGALIAGGALVVTCWTLVMPGCDVSNADDGETGDGGGNDGSVSGDGSSEGDGSRPPDDCNPACEPGNVCVDKQCEVGCYDDHDCPGGLVCDQAYGAHGGCFDYQCVSDAHCDQYWTCIDHSCKFDCDHVNCPAEEPHCVEEKFGCFQCTEDSHCLQGEKCYTLTGICGKGECTTSDECANDEKCADENGMAITCENAAPCRCYKMCSSGNPCEEPNHACQLGACIPVSP
jgi:hypothetical protein